MKLFYYLPPGHGPYSFFVVADNRSDAAEQIEAERQRLIATGRTYEAGTQPITADALTEALPSMVVTHPND